MFILSGFLDEYSTDFTEQLEGAKRLEIHNIELRFVDGVNVANLSEEKVNEIKVILKKENVRVSAIGSPIGKISLDDDFDEHLDTAEKIFKITAQKIFTL
jgi:sugar phosphate isomerase/epimerase